MVGHRTPKLTQARPTLHARHRAGIDWLWLAIDLKHQRPVGGNAQTASLDLPLALDDL